MTPTRRLLLLALASACAGTPGEVSLETADPGPALEADAPRARAIASIGASQHQVQQHAGFLRLVNPATDLHLRLHGAEASLAARHGEAPVQATLGTVRVARGAAELTLTEATLVEGACDPADARRDHEGACLRRAEAQAPGLTAWWDNPAGGLRQGWTVDQLGQGGPLVIEVSTSLDATITPDGVVLGEPATGLHGRDLRAWDADGTALDVRAEDRGDGFALVVDVDDAAWPVTVDPTWTPGLSQTEGNSANALFGGSLAVGDVNGDGVGDLVVGAPGYDASATDAGRVFVFAGPDFTTSATKDPATTSGTPAFGTSVAIGNYNADGFADIAVGVPGYDNGQTNEGAVVVLTGDATLTLTTYRTYETNTASDAFGSAVAWGDVNGDATADDDLLVGCPTCDTTGTNNRGRVFVFRASSSNLPATGQASTQASHNLPGPADDGSRHGSSVVAGDLNGDGYDEVITGVPIHNGTPSGTDYGVVRAWPGSSTGASGTSTILATGTTTSAFLGSSVATGDYNGDGIDDLVIGTRAGGTGGVVSLYLGASGALPTTSTRDWSLGQASANFGVAVAMGDLNGDGRADVIAAADGYDTANGNAGRVAVYMGRASTTSASADATFDGDAANASIGDALVAGSTNAGAAAELFVSATSVANGQTAEGIVVQIDLSAGLDLDDDGVFVPFDCDDADALVGVEQTYYTDSDADTYGALTGTLVCPAAGGTTPAGYAAVSGDCNDASNTIYPTAAETIGSGIDNNCSGTVTCYVDADDDNYRTTDTIASADTDCTDPGEALASDGSGDCDDALATVNPGVTEIVDDGIDQDCSGGDRCYADADNDGYRPSAGATVASANLVCTDPGEATGTDPVGDCNDAAAAVNPGATEIVASGIDEDCASGELCYTDADNDGVGSGATVASPDLACTATGETANIPVPPDCNDANPNIRPGALDVPGNLVDENCDGVDASGGAGDDICDGGAGLLSGTLQARTEADIAITSLTAGDFAGTALVTGDFNGDGDADLAVGLPGLDVNGGLSGGVSLFFGPLDPGQLSTDAADVLLLGGAVRNRIGTTLANAGDVDGDGADDLLVGSNTDTAAINAAGVAYLVLSDTLSSDAEIDLQLEADAVFTGQVGGDLFGLMVASVGDLNEDGFDDLLIGAPFAAGGGVKRGAAYLFYGPVTGVRPAASASAVFNGATDKGSFGVAALSLGDLDGDGAPEFVIGAARDGTAGSEAGAAYTWAGAPYAGGQTVAGAQARLYGRTYNRLGAAFARAGDVDLDGTPDFWVGAKQYGAFKVGAAFLTSGDVTGAGSLESLALYRLYGSGANDLAGSSLLGNIDVDQDGTRDLLIGGERGQGEVVGSGLGWLAYGPFPVGTTDKLRERASTTSFVGAAFNDLAGVSLAAADLDGDGFEDVVMGAPYASPLASDGGLVAIFLGGNDPGDPITFYQDADNDGYGNPAVTADACSVPPGYAENDQDCNDADFAYRPGATEACAGPDLNCDGVVGSVDNDSDGFTACGGDCDDNVASTNPNASDLCFDGVDNDCNGEIDGATADDALTYFADVDGDGYGAALAPLTACTPPFPGLILVGGDCADNDPTRNPDATEVCDLVDNDCDATVDEPAAADAPTWYRDGDNDGAGDPFRSTRACTQPSLLESGSPVNYVTNATDCNDASALQRPGRPEVCNGVDDDCDGAFYLGGGLQAGGVPSARWSRSLGGAAGERVGGGGLLVLPDQDGVRGDELVVGLPGVSTQAPLGGAVLLRRNNVDGGDRPLAVGELALDGGWDMRILGTRRDTRAGASLATGDFNGDGVADLAIGGPGARVPGVDQGAVYVFFGPLANGTFSVEDAPAVVRGATAGSKLGTSVAAGDVDGDGFADLLIGAPGASGGQGSAFVVYGQPTWPATQAAAAGLVAGDASDAIGTTVAIADLDGDLRGDLVVGAPRALDLERGALHVTWGAVSRLAGPFAPSLTLSGSTSGEGLGTALDAAGDPNGDGVSDLLVGTQTNQAWLLRGAAVRWTAGAVASVAQFRLVGSFGAAAGRAVAGVGDVNGDLLDDFVIGAVDDDAAQRDAGAAYLVYGSVSYTSVVPLGGQASLSSLAPLARVNGAQIITAAGSGVLEGARLVGQTASEGLGASVAGGDLDGDGLSDLLVGAPRGDNGALVDAGYLAMFRGGRFGADLDATDPATWWWDNDGDTWTDPASFLACALHVPYDASGPLALTSASDLPDCDDEDDAVYPCAIEQDGDAVDSNCDGSVDRVSDFDGDGLPYGQELLYGTCGELPDTDGDGHTDAEEVYRGSDPTDPGSFILGVEDLTPGAFRVTELMVDPQACTDTNGEYVEVVYVGPARVDIGGIVLYDGTNTRTLSGLLVVSPGDRLVFAQSLAGFAGCYGFNAWGQTGFGFGNSGDIFGMRYATTTIAEVDFTAWTIVGGFAYELDDVDNTTWCLSPDALLNGDRGSPGTANGACAGGALPGLASLQPGDLKITEVMVDPSGCSDEGGEYVEVLYSGAGLVDLTGLRVVDSAGNTATFGPVVASPGQRLVVGRLTTDHTTCYGAQPASAYVFGLDNTGDSVSLLDGVGNVLDAVDFLDWTITPGVAFERDDSVDARWCLAVDTMSTGDIGTRGLANGACPVDDFDNDGVSDAAEPCLGIDPFVKDSDGDGTSDGIEIAAGANPHGPGTNTSADQDGDGISDADEILAGSDPWSGDSDMDGLVDPLEGVSGTGVCLADTDGDGAGDGVELDFFFDPTDPLDRPRLPSDFAAGEVTITEFIANPNSSCAESAEFVEIRYNGPGIALLNGLRVEDATGVGATLAFDLVAVTGSRFALAGNSTDFAACFGPGEPDYETGIQLNNDGDTILVKVGTTVIDSYTYTALEVAEGYSREQDDAVAGTWCPSDSLMASGNRASPAAPNGSCAAALPGPDSLAAGALVVTEFMANPGACGGDDNTYEYFEVLYTGSTQVDLNGLRISDATSTITLSSSLIADPGDHLVFARTSGAFATCYGVTPDATFSLALGNTSDRIRLSNSSITLDEVDWSSGFVITSGKAWELTEPLETPKRWCDGSTVIGATADLGSPGVDNGACPVAPANPWPTLLISEVSDHVTTSLRFIEIYNAGTTSADLSTVRIQRYTNGSTSFGTNLTTLTGTLAAGETYTIGKSSGFFSGEYGSNPDTYSANIDGTGNDVYALAYNNAGTWQVFDTYGVIGVDFAALSYNYDNKNAVRSCRVLSPSNGTTFTESEWIIGANSTNTFGIHDASCRAGTYSGTVTLTWNEGGTDYPCAGTATASVNFGSSPHISGSVSCTGNGRSIVVAITGDNTDQRDGTSSGTLGGTTAWNGYFDALGTPNAWLRTSGTFAHPYAGLGTLSGDLDLQGP